MFKVPEKYRLKVSPFKSDESHGNNGVFIVPSYDKGRALSIIASDGLGWEHVSVHAVGNTGKSFTPSWVEMCQVKDLFWSEDDVVIQYHPAKKDYVNMHPNTLHLWRPIDVVIPTPPLVLV